MLKPGLVCDGCNNYFATKVEGPLLSHYSFRNLRAWYQVPNKRGVHPPLAGFIGGTDIEIGFRLSPNGAADVVPERGSDWPRIQERLRREEAGLERNTLFFPLEVPPPKREMARLMAKMAFEVIALAFSADPSTLLRFIDEEHFGRLRRYARYGDNFDEWPVHQRRIFPEETQMRHPATGEWVQVGFAYDIFLTKRRETYFAFALYGVEYVINAGGPSTKGYEEWLADHARISPLVERVGDRLVEGVGREAGKYFIVGDHDRNRGRDFDREQWSAA